MPKKAQIPTIVVVLGATGDLMERKIAPALFHLFQNKKTPDRFRLVGFSRRPYNDKKFQDHVRQALVQHKDIKSLSASADHFLQLTSYQQGEFSEPASYRALNDTLQKIDDDWGVCTNKLFYLAVPPKLYSTIFNNLAASDLTKPCSEEEGWTRVIVEKPFGDDLKTAQRLEALLGKLFREEQIFRIDHYLAKGMLQNLLAVRFSNNIFEHTFSHEFIESIDLYLLEKKPPVGRGSFYDSVGSLKDVGQNHLLQMLALVTMDQPQAFRAGYIRKKRYELLKTLQPPRRVEVKRGTFRAQYEGYTKLPGVKPRSKTETYFFVQAFLDTPRWKDVPVYLESGKGLARSQKGIVLNIRHSVPCLCPDPDRHYQNKIIFTLDPVEGIRIEFWTKKPGLDWAVEKSALVYTYRKKRTVAQYTEEYEKLLFDCITGDQTLFVSTEEVLAMWKFIDPIVRAWKAGAVSLKKYPLGSDAIRSQARSQSSTGGATRQLPRQLGIIGLGKMGSGLARQLLEKGWQVHGYNRSPDSTKKLVKFGLADAYSIPELVSKLSRPRIIWLMLPAGRIVDQTIEKLFALLERGDIIIDGGNSFYKDTIRRAKKLTRNGIDFVDVGVSGGPEGARHGACLMIGGRKKKYDFLKPLFVDLAVRRGEQFFEGYGAGHFVKMVHNGIEYGMMQAVAEGFDILKKSKYRLHLARVADVYNHGSVIESRLVGWMHNALVLFGDELGEVAGKAQESGEGRWTVQIARATKIPVRVIEDALRARKKSQRRPNFQGKIIQALRNQFGGHDLG